MWQSEIAVQEDSVKEDNNEDKSKSDRNNGNDSYDKINILDVIENNDVARKKCWIIKRVIASLKTAASWKMSH